MAIYREAQVEDGTGHSVRAYFGALVVMILIPGLLIAGWLAYLSAKSERAQIEQGAIQRAHEIAAAIDREIIGMQNLLAVLASSHALHIDDLEGFHRQAVEVSRQLDVRIVLHEREPNRQLLNSAVPWGAPLPQGSPPGLQQDEEEALRTGKPVVSNVFFGPVIKQYMIRVVMPVSKEGAPTRLLGIALPLTTFGQILDRLQNDPDRIGAIIDRNHVIVARSEKHDQFAGTRARSLPNTDADKIARVVTREGVPFHWFRVRSAVSGWRISVGIPDRVLEAPARFAIVSFAIAGGALLLVAVAAAFALGGRVSHAMGLLRTALATARKRGREQFQILFESVPNGLVAVDGDGLIVQVNAKMESLFGYNRDELMGQPIEMLLPDSVRSRHVDFRRAFAAAPQARAMGAGRELFAQRRDGSPFPIEIGLTPIGTSAGNLIMATVVDITERKRAEGELSAALASLRTSEELRRFAVEAAGIGTWNWDVVKSDLYWSDRYKEIIGVPPDAVPSYDLFLGRLHPDDREPAKENLRRALKSGGRYEYSFRIAENAEHPLRWVAGRGRVEHDASGRALRVHGTLYDRTYRKEAELERDELRRRIVQSQEHERLRLAHELHDQTGQTLTAAMLELKGIEAHASDTARDRIRRLSQQLDQMGKSLHHVAWELRPASFDELGLASALAAYVSDWGERCGMAADFHCGDASVDLLPEEVRTTIYRVVQEALTNVAKHAPDASSVSVVIDRSDTMLRLTIEDDGRGFDVASQGGPGNERRGLGHAGMRERLALIGGNVEIESSVGSGTTIFVRIPLAASKAVA